MIQKYLLDADSDSKNSVDGYALIDVLVNNADRNMELEGDLCKRYFKL